MRILPKNQATIISGARARHSLKNRRIKGQSSTKALTPSQVSQPGTVAPHDWTSSSISNTPIGVALTYVSDFRKAGMSPAFCTCSSFFLWLDGCSEAWCFPSATVSDSRASVAWEDSSSVTSVDELSESMLRGEMFDK